MEKKSKLSSAQQKAIKKYTDANLSKISLGIKFKEHDTIIENAKKYNLPTSRYLRNCVKYCINHDINIGELIASGKGV